MNFSDKANRLKEGIENTEDLLNPTPEQVESSMGLRYGFWKKSLVLIRQNPVLGYGTGGFERAYQDLVIDKKRSTSNPHNEFMMIGVQLGIFGLVFYLGFYWSQFACAKQLALEKRLLAQGISVTLLVTSLFNCPLLDHAEGHWFACMIALCFSTYRGQSNGQHSADSGGNAVNNAL